MALATLVDSGNSGRRDDNQTQINDTSWYGTQSLTLSATTNGYLLVFVFPYGGNDPQLNTSFAGATWNGTSMTELGNGIGISNNILGGRLYGLANPSSGTHNFVHTMTTAVGKPGYESVIYFYQTFSNVNQTSPVVTYGSSNQAALTANYTTVNPYDVAVIGAADPTAFTVPGTLTTLTVTTQNETGPTFSWTTGAMYKQYTVAGSQSSSFAGGSSTNNALFYVVLKSNILVNSTSTSDSMGAASSRTQTVGRVGAFLRSLSDSISIGAGRLSGAGQSYSATASVTMGNASSRVAAVGNTPRFGWHNLSKNNAV